MGGSHPDDPEVIDALTWPVLDVVRAITPGLTDEI